MKFTSFPLNVIFICAVLTFKYTETQVPIEQKCSPMRFSNSIVNLQQFAGTWYEFGRYYSKVKKNLICSSVAIVIQDDGFIFIHTGLDVKRDNAMVLAIEGGRLMMTTEDYTPPILKVKYAKTETTVSYQVLDTDYISYAILWSCENKPAGVGSKVFAWVLTRDLHISVLNQRRLMARLDEIGINPDLIMKTSNEDCDVIDAHEVCDILKLMPSQQAAGDDPLELSENTMINESSIENSMISESPNPTSSELNIDPMTTVECPTGFNCYPIATTPKETETPAIETTTEQQPAVELPISEPNCPAGFVCTPVETTTMEKPSEHSPGSIIEKCNETTACPKGYNCTKLPTPINEESTKCTEPNCVPMATCHASTYGGSFGSSTCPKCECPTCPTINSNEENKTENCKQSNPLGTTSDGFTLGNCDNATKATKDNRVMTPTTPVAVDQGLVTEPESSNVNSSDVNATTENADDGALNEINIAHVARSTSKNHTSDDSESTVIDDETNNTTTNASKTPDLTVTQTETDKKSTKSVDKNNETTTALAR